MTSLVGIEGMIVSRSDLRGGRPHIAGTGVSVMRVAALTEEGLTVEEIVRDVFDGHLTHAQVYAALAFYHANRAAIDSDDKAQEQLINQLHARVANRLPSS